MTDTPEDLGETTLHLAGTKPAMVPVVNVPWTAMVLLIVLFATAIIVPVVLSQHDVCDGLDRCVQTVGPKSALTVQGPSYVAPQGAGLQIRF